MTALNQFEQSVYDSGINEGLEKAARHCEETAALARTVMETDCSDAATLYQWRADDIRKLKVKR